MSRIHRVAWRVEKPSRVTANRVYAFVMFVLGIGYLLNAWALPPTWCYGVLLLSLAASAFADDLSARNEHHEYLRMKAALK